MHATGGVLCRTLYIFSVVFTLFITSCNAGSGGGASLNPVGSQSNSQSDGDGSVVAALGGNYSIGARVGEFELSAPVGDSTQGNSFLIHGTLPVPMGAFPAGQTSSWLGVANYDGNIVPAQLDVVTRYGNGDTAVFEITARVQKDPNKAVGTRVVYPVYLLSDSTGASFPTTGPTNNVPAEIADLASGARKILIVATDVFGNKYYSAPLGMAHKKIFREGPYATTVRSYQTLKPYPVVSGSQGTLPELLGVHSFLTLREGEKTLGLDLRIHNGMVGADPTQQDPIRPVYVQSVQVCVPAGYTVLNSLNDPLFEPTGNAFTFDGKDYLAFDLVKALANGKMHVIDQQAQTHRRLAITLVGNEARARGLLDLEGIAFNRAGFDSTGQALWSWWNPQTANFMQGNPLPNLNYWGAQTLRNSLAGKYNQDKQTFEAGTVTGTYPWQDPGGPLGGQSAGVKYGGMTGGTDIYMNNGVEAAFAGSRESVLHAQLLNQAYANRQPWALFNPDGSSVSIEQLKKTNGSGNPCVPFKFFMAPEGNAALSYFKLNAGQTFHESYVAAHGLAPAYEADHFAFKCQDYQHLIRYTRHLLVLLFLKNDSLAKEDLEATANNCRMAEPELPNCSNGQGYGVLSAWNGANANPGVASGFFGRGQGWSSHVSAIYYAAADDAWRTQTLPWFDKIVDTAKKTQVPCTGVLYCNVNSKFDNPNHRQRQHFEQAIWHNSLKTIAHNVYEGTANPRETLTLNVLREAAYSFILPVAWANGQGPWKFLSVSDLNLSTAPTFCTLPLPPNSSGHVDNYMVWDTFAYGYQLTGDVTFINRAMECFGGTMAGLKGYLEKVNYQSNLENSAVLLRTMQDLGWIAP